MTCGRNHLKLVSSYASSWTKISSSMTVLTTMVTEGSLHYYWTGALAVFLRGTMTYYGHRCLACRTIAHRTMSAKCCKVTKIHVALFISLM